MEDRRLRLEFPSLTTGHCGDPGTLLGTGPPSNPDPFEPLFILKISLCFYHFFRRSSLSCILQVERLVKSLDEAYPEVAVIIETDLDLKKVLTLSRFINLNCFPILGLNRSWKRC